MRKKLFKKIGTLCVSLSMLISIGSTQVIASTNTNAPSFAFNLLGGIGEYGESSRKWCFSSNNVYYMACAKLALDSWMDTSVNGMANYISFVQTSNESQATLKIIISADGETCGYNGKTNFFFNYGRVLPNASPWDRAVVTYNTTNGVISEYESEAITSVFAHEIGHAFGLDENNSNTNSIMCQWDEGRSVMLPTSNDIWSAIAIYVK
ncbi:MAG: hypothetical protein IJA34_16315 [Lachnospiraceae bacterium]|nr:hypothetical protein [Lachnospiraceae bacterium]